MNARQIIEMLTEAAPAPAAPPRPATRPEAPPAPAKPAAPKPKRFDNPWRRRQIRPGEEPAPKACAEAQEACPAPAPAASHQGRPWTEDRVLNALKDPNVRAKIERQLMLKPDDGSPEWEAEAVRRTLQAIHNMQRKQSGQRLESRHRPQTESVRARDLFA